MLFPALPQYLAVSGNYMKPPQPIILLILTVHLLCCTPKEKKAKITEVVLTETEDLKTRAFINFWKDFSLKFNSLDSESIKKITLDTIWLWGDRVSSMDFIKRYHDSYSSSDLPKIILDTNKTSYSWIGCHPVSPINNAVKDYDEITKKYRNACNCMEATINDTIGSAVNAYKFTFLETTKGYRIFGITSYSHSWAPANSSVDTTTVK